MSREVVSLLVRRMNRTALRVGIPNRYWRDHDIREGDLVIWTPQPDGTVRLKFVKTRETEQVEEAMAEAS
jgi:hypothetical protein